MQFKGNRIPGKGFTKNGLWGGGWYVINIPGRRNMQDGPFSGKKISVTGAEYV